MLLSSLLCLPSLAGCKEDATWKSEGKVSIAAGAELLKPWLQELPRWSNWSVFNAEGLAANGPTVSGPPSGAGATLVWRGANKLVGGKLEFSAADANAAVSYKSTTLADAPNGTGRLTVVPDGKKSTVTWTDAGKLHVADAVKKAAEVQAARDWMIQTSLQKLTAEAEEAAAWQAKMKAKQVAEEQQRKREALAMPKEGPADGD